MLVNLLQLSLVVPCSAGLTEPTVVVMGMVKLGKGNGSIQMALKLEHLAAVMTSTGIGALV